MCALRVYWGYSVVSCIHSSEDIAVGVISLFIPEEYRKK